MWHHVIFTARERCSTLQWRSFSFRYSTFTWSKRRVTVAGTGLGCGLREWLGRMRLGVEAEKKQGLLYADSPAVPENDY